MITLSLELSTPRASIAILRKDTPIATASWLEPQARHQRVFTELPRLLQSAGQTWNSIDLFAVGRGPGAFSGIRIALMAARMFALPEGRPVVAVSSAEALACTAPAGRVLVCGDARRGMFWYGLVEDGACGSWSLCRPADWPGVLSATRPACVVTSQWDRTRPLRDGTGSEHAWLAGDHLPEAADVARLARSGRLPEPLTPIYLHPPV